MWANTAFTPGSACSEQNKQRHYNNNRFNIIGLLTAAVTYKELSFVFVPCVFILIVIQYGIVLPFINVTGMRHSGSQFTARRTALISRSSPLVLRSNSVTSSDCHGSEAILRRIEPVCEPN